MMNFNGWSILFGITLLFVGSYALIAFFTFLFIRIALKNKEKFRKYLAITIATFAWVLSTLFAFMIASPFGGVAFALLSGLFIFGSLFLISKRFLSIDGKHKIVYSLSLAILLNPAWLFLAGVLT